LQRATGQARTRIHWCPTGAFNFVPIHAAGIYDGAEEERECVADYVVSSYTPTLAALSRAQNGTGTFSVKESRLLLIAAGRAHDPSLPTLFNIEEETQHIVQIAEKVGISQEVYSSATISQVTTSIKSAQLVHVACHGIQDGKEPLKSAFHLSDGYMTVSKLMELDLNAAFFAFLSACDTAKGDENQPDQTIHLAATMLFVGFKSVVATMW
jgi:CHAT domain-containing protein